MIKMQKEHENQIHYFYDKIFNKNYDSEEFKKCLKFKNTKLPTFFQYIHVKYTYYLLNKNLMFINQFTNYIAFLNQILYIISICIKKEKKS